MIRNGIPVLAVMLLLGASGAKAQTDSTAAPEAAPTTPSFAVPDKPPAELARLKFLVGTWNAKTHIYASPLGPESNGTSRTTYRWGFAGMHLEGAHDIVRGGKRMTGRSTWGWDADRKQYQMVWVDALTPVTFLYHGTFPQESTLVVFATNMIGGKAFTEKMTMNFTGPNSYALTIENDLTGEMRTIREETGTRVKASPKKKPAASSTSKKAG